MNIVSMNFLNTKINAFTATGEFLTFDVSLQKHQITEASVQHIDQLLTQSD